MSFKAINKNDSTVYTLDEWERNLIHVTPYCPVCGEVTEIKAAGSTEVKTHFAHSIQGTDCPTINDNRRKYALLPPVDPDTENGNNLINWTKVNVWHLYTKCKEILHGRLRFQEFSDMLTKANEKGIWFYKGLTSNTLPYVLIVNYGVFNKIDGRTEEVWHTFDKDKYGDDLFLQKGVTHMWRITKSDIDKVKLDYLTRDTGKPYVWDFVKSFYK